MQKDIMESKIRMGNRWEYKMRLETLQTDQGWFKDKSRAIWLS